MFLTTTLVAGTALAQNDEPSQSSQQNAGQHFAELSTFVGADVHLVPGEKTRRPSGDEGEGREQKKAGEVDDILVNADTGALEWAVVSFDGLEGVGDKAIAVPLRELRWNEKDKTFRLDLNAQQLQQLPKYDLEAARKEGLDTSIAVVEASWVTVREPMGAATGEPQGEAGAKSNQPRGEEGTKQAQTSTHQGEKSGEQKSGGQKSEPLVISGKSYLVIPTRLVLASEIDDYDVYAQQDEVGSLSKAIVDTSKWNVDFAVVSSGGVAGIGANERLIPFRAMTLCQCVEDEKDLVYHIDRSKKEVEQAVAYEKPEQGVLDPQMARKARESFGGSAGGR